MCDLENLVNEEAIARDWAAAPSEKKKLPVPDYFPYVVAILVQAWTDPLWI
jgi:hypothetical protein